MCIVSKAQVNKDGSAGACEGVVEGDEEHEDWEADEQGQGSAKVAVEVTVQATVGVKGLASAPQLLRAVARELNLRV